MGSFVFSVISQFKNDSLNLKDIVFLLPHKPLVMKNIIALFISVLILSSCGSQEKLNRETALKILKENQGNSKVSTYSIFITDPTYAKRMIDAGLEDDGLLKVKRTQKLIEVGEPLIIFTEKSLPYLINQTEEDKADRIQRVKIADEVIDQVTGIQMLEGGNRAVVEYNVSFKNISPFSKLYKENLNNNEARKVDFILYDDGWRTKIAPYYSN